jgi:phosphatidylinositol glycan class Q protein
LLNITQIGKISSLAEQFQLRIEQLLFWPPQYFQRHQSEFKLSPVAQAQYIGFFNTFWLIANDIIIGLAFKTIILANHEYLAIQIQFIFESICVRWVAMMLKWIMSWPAGLKLNRELGEFLTNLFEWMIYAFRQVISSWFENFPSIVYYSGYAGTIGATMVFAAYRDLVSLLTIHLKMMHLVSSRIHNWSLAILYSTFNLFRGKKWNPLRNRVDKAEYDLDQLLLGTVMFTLLVFLLPTIAVLYFMFVLVRLY